MVGKMKKHLMMLVLLLMGFGNLAVFGQESEKLVTIGLAQNQERITLIVSRLGDHLYDYNEKRLRELKFEGTQLNFTWDGSQIVVNDQPVSAGPLIFTSKRKLPIWDNRPYRGELVITATNGKLNLINRLPLEDYLRGVLPKEVSASWPLAALKAQAISARTYTYASLNKHLQEGFNLCATTHCQVYGGAEGETPATDRAVVDTYNQVMVYEGQIIAALYHSSSGGFTEDAKNIWGMSFPYLKPVEDWDQNSPFFDWSCNFDWQQVRGMVERVYPELGRVYRIEPAEYGEQGQLLQVRLKGDLDTITITGESLRFLLKLRSSKIKLGMIYGPDPLVQLAWSPLTAYPEAVVISSKVSGVVVEMIDPPWDQPDPWSWLQDKEPRQLLINGKGWGHRVGMSQWGAKAMADVGFDEQQILKHYYQGIDIVDVARIAPAK